MKCREEERCQCRSCKNMKDCYCSHFKSDHMCDKCDWKGPVIMCPNKKSNGGFYTNNINNNITFPIIKNDDEIKEGVISTYNSYDTNIDTSYKVGGLEKIDIFSHYHTYEDPYIDKYVLHQIIQRQIIQFGDSGLEQKEEILAISDHLSEMIDYCINNNHKILEHSWCTVYITLNNKQVSRSEIIDTIAELYLDTEDRIKNKLS